jgi:uncharacterized protein YycO
MQLHGQNTLLQKQDLHQGDLIFCSATSSSLSKAIDQSTQTSIQTHFDHVGIVEIAADTIWILHAAPKKGVCRETLTSFVRSDSIYVDLTIYRLKNKYAKSLKSALFEARKCLGYPYKYSYRLKDSGFYCSEYIYFIFKPDSVFSLKPMSFKDSNTGVFLPAWVLHYQKLGIHIPEGELGCNPNGLASSEKLERMGVLNDK